MKQRTRTYIVSPYTKERDPWNGYMLITMSYNSLQKVLKKMALSSEKGLLQVEQMNKEGVWNHPLCFEEFPNSGHQDLPSWHFMFPEDVTATLHPFFYAESLPYARLEIKYWSFLCPRYFKSAAKRAGRIISQRTDVHVDFKKTIDDVLQNEGSWTDMQGTPWDDGKTYPAHV